MRRTAIALVGALALGDAVATAAAQPRERTCVEALRWTGDVELVDAARATLSAGALTTVPEARCEGVEVHLQRSRGSVRVVVRRAEQVVRYATNDATTLPSWIESWLLPDAESPPTTVRAADPTDAASHDVAPVEAAARVQDEPEPEPAPARAEEPDDAGRTGAARLAAERAQTPGVGRGTGVPMLASVRLGGDLDHIAPAWLSGELELALGLGSQVWISLAASGAWSPEQGDTGRSAWRAAARVGYRYRAESGLLRIGAGAGLVAASAEQEFDAPGGQIVATDEEIAPIVEVYTGYELALGRGWALSIAGILRGCLPDDAFDDGDTPGEARLPLADPAPLPVLAVTLSVGLTFGLGDAW